MSNQIIPIPDDATAEQLHDVRQRAGEMLRARQCVAFMPSGPRCTEGCTPHTTHSGMAAAAGRDGRVRPRLVMWQDDLTDLS